LETGSAQLAAAWHYGRCLGRAARHHRGAREDESGPSTGAGRLKLKSATKTWSPFLHLDGSRLVSGGYGTEVEWRYSYQVIPPRSSACAGRTAARTPTPWHSPSLRCLGSSQFDATSQTPAAAPRSNSTIPGDGRAASTSSTTKAFGNLGPSASSLFSGFCPFSCAAVLPHNSHTLALVSGFTVSAIVGVPATRGLRVSARRRAAAAAASRQVPHPSRRVWAPNRPECTRCAGKAGELAELGPGDVAAVLDQRIDVTRRCRCRCPG
jgi:hypothetical protein